MKKKRLVIVGAGFAGIELARKIRPLILSGHYSVQLISTHGYFEYYPGIYRIIIGETPIQTRVDLDLIVPPEVEIIEDTIEKIDTENKKLFSENENGANVYEYDELVLALGSVPNYFNIEGLEQQSFVFRTTGDAVILRNHLHEIFKNFNSLSTTDSKNNNLHVIICGGGPIGVELAGSLSSYMKMLAYKYKISPNKITINLVDAGDRVLPRVPESASKKVATFLNKKGVNLFLNRPILKIENETVLMDDVTLNAKTIVWTAGVLAHPLYGATQSLKCEKGRVVVDEYMQAVGQDGVYVLGDGACTDKAGLAQTAIFDGKYLAKYLKAKAYNKSLPKYTGAKTGYVIPIGSNWALMISNKFIMAGLIPGIVRYFIDVEYFLKRLKIATFLDLYWQGIKYRRQRYIIDENIRTSLESRKYLQSKFNKKNNQSGRAVFYIIGFIAIIFVGILGLGYFNNKIEGKNTTINSLFGK